MTKLVVYIGYDPREDLAYRVCKKSIESNCSSPIEVRPLRLSTLQYMGILTRTIEKRNGGYYDPISQKPMSTEFSVSRFAIPYICNDADWALFMDCDMIMKADVWRVLDYANPAYAVQCTKHEHVVEEGQAKMDDQKQVAYSKKNWSSFCLWNLNHPANDRLTHEVLNETGKIDLHQFCWLEEDEIGSIPLSWNYLVGYSVKDYSEEVNNIHFTEGIPSMEGYENCEFSEEWDRLVVEVNKEQ